jgi:hypothetical protein
MHKQIYAPRIPSEIHLLSQMGFYQRKRFWRYHQENLARLVLLKGISIKEYAELHGLELRLAYTKFRIVGVAALRQKFWARHRQQFNQELNANGTTVEAYIQRHKLHQKNARQQLTRKPMSAIWEMHCRRYAHQSTFRKLTIAQYAKENNLNPSTTRHYIHKGYRYPK